MKRTDEVVLHLLQDGFHVVLAQTLGAHQAFEHSKHAPKAAAALGPAQGHMADINTQAHPTVTHRVTANQLSEDYSFVVFVNKGFVAQKSQLQKRLTDRLTDLQTG